MPWFYTYDNFNDSKACLFTDVAIGFNQTLYEVSESEPLASIFVVITRGTLQREIIVNVSTQDDTALGLHKKDSTN